MKFWMKWVVGGVVGLALIFLVFVVVERVRGEWALNSRLKALKGKGEVLSLESLIPKRADSNLNVATELLKLGKSLRNTNLFIPSLPYTPGGHGVVMARLDEWPVEKQEISWERVGSVMEQAHETIHSIETAVGKPQFDSGVDYKNGFLDLLIPTLPPTKEACVRLNYSVLYQLKKSDLSAAHLSLSNLVMLTAKQSPEPLIICQLLRQACGTIAFNVTWQALQSEGWNDAQLASIQNAWAACDFVKDMESAMGMERAMNLDQFQQIQDSKQKLESLIGSKESAEGLLGGAFGTLPTHGFVLHRLHLPVWRIAWLAQDELASLDQWQNLIEQARSARTNGSVILSTGGDESTFGFFPSSSENQSKNCYDRLRFLLSDNSGFLSEKLVRRTCEVQTQQQMAITALAIERYKLREGKIPPDLSALVPGYMDRLPKDFMDGKTLRYRANSDGKGFVLYSVGEDGKDDGGDSTRRDKARRYSRIWDGVDAVWPSAANEDEAVTAFEKRK